MKKQKTINGMEFLFVIRPSKALGPFVFVFQDGEKSPIFGTNFSPLNSDFEKDILPWAKKKVAELFPSPATNEILLNALKLWPENEPEPSFRRRTFGTDEWVCYCKSVESSGKTLEESLYHFARMSQDSAGQIVPSSNFGPVVDYLGDYVRDPLFDS